MRSGDRCGGTLPLDNDDAATAARVLKGRVRPRIPRSVSPPNPVRVIGTVRAVAGSNVNRFVDGAGRLEERIAHTLTEAARPAVAGHLVVMAVILGGFLAAADLSGWLLPVARIALAVTFVWVTRRLGRRLRYIRFGPAMVTVPSQVSVLWLALLPWLLTVWLAAPLVFGWLGVGLPYVASGVLLALTLIFVLVSSVRAVADARDAAWRRAGRAAGSVR